MQFEMVRNAKVAGFSATSKGLYTRKVLKIIVNDKYEHRFRPSDKESEYLEYARPEAVAERLNGGSFFFVGDKLIDYRSADYQGYIHDDRSINALAEHVGLQSADSPRRGVVAPNPVFQRNRFRGLSNGIMLGGVHHEFDFNVESMGLGAAFDINLLFRWNPFREVVSSVLEVLRLICTNGMVGMSPLINSQIPLINKHKEHLAIAANQIEHRFVTIMKERLLEMVETRATVSDLKYVRDQAFARMRNANQSQAGLARLGQIGNIADPVTHLAGFYSPEDFMNEAKMKLLDGHLTEYDVWNMLTEIDSHSVDPDEATQGARQKHNSALQLRANKMLFDSVRLGRREQRNAALCGVPLSKEGNHEEAFFNAIQAVA